VDGNRTPTTGLTGTRQSTFVLRLGLLALLWAFSTPPAHALTFVVDSTGDGGAVNPATDGTCDAQNGPSVVCTLRAAIEEANAIGGSHTIQFNIGGGRAPDDHDRLDPGDHDPDHHRRHHPAGLRGHAAH
jgi:CSLREA domain-containing protein